MGNSESQYSLQGSKLQNGSIASNVKQKPCSLKIRSIHAKGETSCSAHGWGNGTGTGPPNYKSRSLARSCLSQFKSNPPYGSRHSDIVVKPSKSNNPDKHRATVPGNCCQGNNNTYFPENGYHYVGIETPKNHVDSRECNGHIVNGYRVQAREPLTLEPEDRKSPKVLIKTLGKLDGCLRVEFHNGNNSRVPEEESNGPVQLLRYSPTPESKAPNIHDVRRNSSVDYTASHGLSARDSGLRSSKGSSLSSESSWYDCPWGNARDINEMDGSYLTRSTPDTSTHGGLSPNDNQQPFNQRSSLTSLREFYKDSAGDCAMPSGNRLSDDYINAHTGLSNRVSFASEIDVPSRVQHTCPAQYSSYTLPCRKSKPLTEDASKKDSLKSRMRRISDWTGSLSRKKRKIQEWKEADGAGSYWYEASSPYRWAY